MERDIVAKVTAAQRPYEEREAKMAVAAVLARAGLADSARHVLVSARGDKESDPAGELLHIEAYVRTLVGDKDEAIRLLGQYLTANPEHRDGFAADNAWRWRSLRDDKRFRQMVGSGS